MRNIRRTLALRTLPLLVGLSAAGFAIGASTTASKAAPLHCEIQADSTNGMMVLQGVVHTDTALSGSYRFRVTGAAANISQGGAFTAAPGQPATLGNVMLGNNGTPYDISLEVNADGVTILCDERVGGAI